MADLRLQGVSKVFPGGVNALDDINLQIADGEMIAVLGPSGCGKTTLLRVIAGLDDVTSGTVSFNGRPMNGCLPRDRNVAMVLQNSAVYPHMTVRRNLAFGPTLRRVNRDEVARRVQKAAELLGLTELLDRLPQSLSGGEQRRVALGRAIVVEPACTLYDEPLGGLDATLSRRLRGELRGLHRRLARTAIYVTHDQAEALSLGNRVAVMAEGRIRQVATPDEIYRQPADRFVAGFVGDPPMNFVERAIEGKTVVIGVRPSALTRSSNGEFVVRVQDVTVVGDHADVHGQDTDGGAITARLSAHDAPQPGETVRFTAARDALYRFEPGRFGRAL
jgi:ABC-type sugar transport system ATPase subunit